ncbi:MAG: hormogonium polysaccharide secretion pseudopilin HpsC [Trichodesmium sp.]
MKTLPNSLIKKLSLKRRSPLSKSTSGFTMIELLVATVIATIIIVPMLAFVVDILNRDVREQAKTNSEQELQAAVDYIAQDMSQAFYIYDRTYAGDTTNDIPSYDTFKDELPFSDDNNPILVFWKREFVDKALDPSGGICEDTTEPKEDRQCNDTFVQSLVAYYLIDDDNETWCQPSGDTCPKRIARFQIQDGVKDALGNYVCGASGRSSECNDDSGKKKFQRDLGYSSYETEPTNWTKAEGEEYTNDRIVLVNYIEDFTLDSVTNNELAKITIQGNGLRRIQTNTDCDNSPTYCPEATAQVGGRSGFGQ